MINKEQLNSINFYSDFKYHEFYDNGPDFMFDIKTQMLYDHCEVDGVLDVICKVTDFEKLKEVLSLQRRGIL